MAVWAAESARVHLLPNSSEAHLELVDADGDGRPPAVLVHRNSFMSACLEFDSVYGPAAKAQEVVWGSVRGVVARAVAGEDTAVLSFGHRTAASGLEGGAGAKSEPAGVVSITLRELLRQAAAVDSDLAARAAETRGRARSAAAAAAGVGLRLQWYQVQDEQVTDLFSGSTDLKVEQLAATSGSAAAGAGAGGQRGSRAVVRGVTSIDTCSLSELAELDQVRRRSRCAAAAVTAHCAHPPAPA